MGALPWLPAWLTGHPAKVGFYLGPLLRRKMPECPADQLGLSG